MVSLDVRGRGHGRAWERVLGHVQQKTKMQNAWWAVEGGGRKRVLKGGGRKRVGGSGPSSTKIRGPWPES